MRSRQDAYYWRLFATALCYVLVGLGGLVLGLIVFPALSLIPGGPVARRRRARRIMQGALRSLIRIMQAFRVLTFDFQHADRLGRPGQVILANHPTLIDVVFLLAFASSSSCIVKSGLWKNPVTRGPAVAAGYVRNSPTDRMIESATDALREGQSVIIFPEGTRTVPDQRLHFHRGAAAIAVRAAVVVTPVYISCSPATLAKGIPWYRIPDRRVHLSLRVGEDIDPEPFRAASPGPVAARAFNEYLLGLFEAELAMRR